MRQIEVELKGDRTAQFSVSDNGKLESITLDGCYGAHVENVPEQFSTIF